MWEIISRKYPIFQLFVYKMLTISTITAEIICEIEAIIRAFFGTTRNQKLPMKPCKSPNYKTDYALLIYEPNKTH